MVDAATIGLVIEAIRNSVSRVIDVPCTDRVPPTAT
jgi:hypothetical protein